MTTLGQSSSTAAVIWGDFIAQCKLWLGHNCSDFSDPQELKGMAWRRGKANMWYWEGGDLKRLALHWQGTGLLELCKGSWSCQQDLTTQ